MSDKTIRCLAFDTSLGAPGVALIEVKNRKPRIIETSHIKTDSKSQSIPLRADIVESWATLFIEKHIGKGFDIIAREDFQGRSSQQNYPVFAAWLATERAVTKFDLAFDKYVYFTESGRRKQSHGVSQSRAKTLVTGRGSASKDEVEQAVREITGYTGEFGRDDESDACCVALAYLIQDGYIDDIHGKLNKYDRGEV
jgi:crossover junction endodeoxyribonuclease RuvC